MHTNLQAIQTDPVLRLLNAGGRERVLEHFKWKPKQLDDYILEITAQCNPEFFDKHSLVIQTKSGQLVPLIDNPVQKKIQVAIDRQVKDGKPVRLKIPKARRHGVSTKTQAIFFSDAIYLKHLQMLTVCHDMEGARNMREMFQRYLDHYPRRKPKFASVRGSDKWWKSKDRDVSYMIDTAEELDTGRSFTYHRLHLSEVAFYRDPQTLMTGLLRSVDRNPNTAIIAESTANGMGGWWYDFVMNENDYELLFFPWFEDAGNVIAPNDEIASKIIGSMSEHEKWLQSEHKCSLAQLNWRRHEIKNGFNDDEDLFRQEYPSSLEESFITSGRPFFQPVTKIRSEFHRTAKLPRRTGRLEWKEYGETVEFVEDRGGLWLMMADREPGYRNRYVTGSDPAEGIAAGANNKDPDFAVCTVFDRQTHKEVARFRARAETDTFANEIYKSSIYFGSGCDCVERNSPGIAVVGILKNTQVNLFRKETLGKESDDEREELGFRTDVNTRDSLLSEFRTAFKQGKYGSDDNIFWDEMARFVYNEKGKALAQSGSHDDCVFSSALTQQALSQAGPVEKITEEEKKKPVAGDVDTRWKQEESLPYATF